MASKYDPALGVTRKGLVGGLAASILAASCLVSPGMAYAQQYAPMTLLNLTDPQAADANASTIWADDVASNTSHFATTYNRPPPLGFNSPFSVYESIFQSSAYTVTVGLASSVTTCTTAPNSATSDIQPEQCTLRVNTVNSLTGATSQQEFPNVCLLIPSLYGLSSAAWGTQAAFDGTTLYVTTLVNGAPSQGCAFRTPVMAP